MRTSAKKPAKGTKPELSPRYRNDRAFWRLKPYIDKTYPPGQYIGIVDEKIVADAADFDTLHERLKIIEKRPSHRMIMQAGVDYIREAVDIIE